MVRLSSLFLRNFRPSFKRKFIDSVRITVKGGRGGNGLPKYGGIGGKGGDVYVEAKENYTLAKLKREFISQYFTAGAGGNSKRFQILGSPGDDVVINCPTGVTALDKSNIIGELNKVGDKVLLAKGGCGGGPQNGYIGHKGHAHSLTLDLKLLADIGFVGYPNAGKSTLLKALSRADPKIASYPFTTLEPNIGVLCYDDFRSISAADLPGLIEGAHMNYGMGHKFLKHCLRTKILLFVVDIEGFRLNPMTSYRNPYETIMLLTKELELYDEELLMKPALLAVNKMDMDVSEEKFNELKERLECPENMELLPEELRPSSAMKFDAVIPISAKNGTNILHLKQKVRTIIDIYEEEKTANRKNESKSSLTTNPDVIYA